MLLSATYYLIGNQTHHAITCLVLKAGSSSWREFYWKLREPDKPFKETSFIKDVAAFKKIGSKIKIQMWKVRDCYNSEFFFCNEAFYHVPLGIFTLLFRKVVLQMIWEIFCNKKLNC